MSSKISPTRTRGILGLTTLTLINSACTGTIPGAFRLAQQLETFQAQMDVNTKIDLLWVVDNSSSMDVSQEKLRNGFTTFARKYLQPTWDIRVAVITTDTYMANPAFSNFLGKTLNGSTGWSSPYINGQLSIGGQSVYPDRLTTFTNPISRPNLVDLNSSSASYGKFVNGVTFNDLVPAWGASYAQLIPGIHDGPIAGFCFEGLPYFLWGASQCTIRDHQNLYNGPARCLNPDTSAGETSLTQCVNTTQNDTIHSGKAIISTMPSTALSGAALEAWTQNLINDFMINVTTGSVGHGSERGLGSVIQLIQDNEKSPTAFFRPGSLRGIIFVSDEDDQTLTIDSSPQADFEPFTHYQCDQASLLSMNPNNNVKGNYGFCCSEANQHCRYGAEGTTCASKTVDDFTYTISVCPNPSLLMPVTTVKNQLDAFFNSLDGNKSTVPNYFVVSIVALTGDAIRSLQESRQADDSAVGQGTGTTWHTIAVDRGDRYIELGNLVGNGSMAMNIAESDYSPILDAIGRAIIEKKSTYTLARPPTSSENMIVTVIHGDGSATVIPSSQYTIQGNSIIIDSSVVLSFSASDRISVNYEPKSVN